ncbi:MAG: hypothetical protein IJU57_06855 [Clostridia bacterium]|nr:hypothetical protein [Clostridia bacterium]
MLLGNYAHSLDTKNRIVIPSKMADELTGKLYIYPAISVKCIKLFNKTEWDKYIEMIYALPKDKEYKVRQMILPRTLEVIPDGQNRIPIAQNMLDHAGIAERDVYIIGMGEYCEIWDRKLYDEVQREFMDPETIEYIRELGL